MTNRRTRQIWKQTLIASQSLSNTWKYRDIIRGPSKVETQNFESHKKGCAETEMEGRTSLMRLLPGRCKILRLYRVTPSLFRTKTGCAWQYKSKNLLRPVAVLYMKISRYYTRTIQSRDAKFCVSQEGMCKTEVKGRLSLLWFLPGRRKILRLYWAYAIIVLNKTGCARIFKSKLSSRLVVLFLRKIINIHNTPMNQTGVKHGIDSNHNCKCCIIISIRSDNLRKVLYNICTFLTHVMNTLLWWVAVVFQT